MTEGRNTTTVLFVLSAQPASVRITKVIITCESLHPGLHYYCLAKMHNRENVPEDPWVSIRDHGERNNEMVYGENASPDHNQILNTSEGGMDVYINVQK